MTVTQIVRESSKATDTRIRPLDITVLSGGPGVERQVSLWGGRQVHAALNHLGHRSTLCDIGPDDLTALERRVDFVFVVLHGEFGEDGAVQDELDRRGLRYSGSDAAASRLAMNKVLAKRRFVDASIPTPDFEHVDASRVAGVGVRWGRSAVVKPVCSGSSVDTYICEAPDELVRCVQDVVGRYGQALIERYVKGPELTVGVLGGRPLPVCEIRTKREFYDYQAKYLDDDTEYVFDRIELPEPLLRRVQDMSLAAHRGLGCRVFSRVDWKIDASTLTPYCLEVNTIPGFTAHSLLPKAAERIGLSFEDLCQRIVELSLDVR